MGRVGRHGRSRDLSLMPRVLGPGEPSEEPEIFRKRPNRKPVGESKTKMQKTRNRNACLTLLKVKFVKGANGRKFMKGTNGG